MKEKNVVNENGFYTAFLLMSIALLFVGAEVLRSGIKSSYIPIIMLGSLMILICIYAIPMFAGKLAKQHLYNKIEREIEEKGGRDIDSISKNIRKNKIAVIKGVEYLIENKFIEGYDFDGQHLINKKELGEAKLKRQKEFEELQALRLEQEKKKLNEANNKTYVIKCASCGARITTKDKHTICPYCGSGISAEV